MFTVIRNAAHWVGRHTLAAIAAGVLVVGGVGGGVGYTLASQHSSAAPASATSGSTKHAPGHAGTGGRAATKRGQKFIDAALSAFAAQTGQSVASIRSQLAAGKSLDDIAGARAPQIQAEVIAEITKLADRAVAAGKLTSTQESAALTAAQPRVAALMAEPGTQLIADVDSLLKLLDSRGPAALLPTLATPTPGG